MNIINKQFKYIGVLAITLVATLTPLTILAQQPALVDNDPGKVGQNLSGLEVSESKQYGSKKPMKKNQPSRTGQNCPKYISIPQNTKPNEQAVSTSGSPPSFNIQKSPVSHPNTSDDTQQYWTRERMRNAKPINMEVRNSSELPRRAISNSPKPNFNVDSAPVSQTNTSDVNLRGYWTQERMQNAKPINMVVDPRCR